MIWVRTSSNGAAANRSRARARTSLSSTASPVAWLRDPATAIRLSGIDGPWHLVSGEETPAMRQFHWSLARPMRSSQRWVEQCVTHGPSWITALEQQPALLSITVEGAIDDAGAWPGRADAPSCYSIVQRARWNPEPAPLGLDLQLLTMDTEAGTDVRLTFVNCFVDPDQFEIAHRTFVEHLEAPVAA